MPFAIALLLLVPVSGAAEGPAAYTCDEETGVLVCTGAESGSTVDCGPSPVAEATCTYTYGWIFDAFSPAGLPGEAVYEYTYQVEACISGQGCQVIDSGADSQECAWLPTDDCVVAPDGSGSYGPVSLDPGECLTVTVTTTADAQAWVTSQSVVLASATDVGPGQGSGAVCNFSDGR